MHIRKLKNCPEIVAGDKTILRELLHPDRDYPFSGRYSLAHAVLGPGQSSEKHFLTSDEVYYILAGSGQMHINDESASVEAADAIDIPPGSVQWIANTGESDLEFLCIVDPAWRAEDEDLID
ncbi:MAG: cupin domain-containing protein [Candidatus Zixiibacteriota bacterium]|nr:MAG: cupin domain-containing protein [candidate division Zixibacteria bacterium]